MYTQCCMCKKFNMIGLNRIEKVIQTLLNIINMMSADDAVKAYYLEMLKWCIKELEQYIKE